MMRTVAQDGSVDELRRAVDEDAGNDELSRGTAESEAGEPSVRFEVEAEDCCLRMSSKLVVEFAVSPLCLSPPSLLAC